MYSYGPPTIKFMHILNGRVGNSRQENRKMYKNTLHIINQFKKHPRVHKTIFNNLNNDVKILLKNQPVK